MDLARLAPGYGRAESLRVKPRPVPGLLTLGMLADALDDARERCR